MSSAPSGYQRLEDVIGCKWSVSVLMAISHGIHRPGELQRHISGISTKVLNQRLVKLSAYGLINKTVYPETLPRTEYALTTAGQELAQLVKNIQQLDARIQTR
jgi:DNA-binding HxlR family transcriptional regulator